MAQIILNQVEVHLRQEEGQAGPMVHPIQYLQVRESVKGFHIPQELEVLMGLLLE